MMEVTSILWILAFSFLLLFINTFYPEIRHFLANQPPGSKSVYHIVAKNTLLINQVTGTIYCLYSILSRFDCIVDFLNSDMKVCVLISLVYEFAFSTTALSLGAMAMIRLLCLINISLMEETIGEFSIRVLHFGFTIIFSIVSCGVLFASGDILLTPVYNLMTGQANPTGKTVG